MKQKGWICYLLAPLVICLLLGGCKNREKKIEKLRDLEFTVAEDADLPKELKELMEEKKQEIFKLSYSDGEYLYIAYGYGVQKTGGYSIQVESLYEAENAIYIETTLLGPAKEEPVSNTPSYPYVVVKTEFMEKNIVFE